MFRKIGISAQLVLCFVSCVFSSTPLKKSRGLEAEEKQRLLDLHNLVRAKIAVGKAPNQPSAGDMMALEWDDRLMKQAQRWADHCSSHMHDSLESRRFGNYPTIGQNYVGSSTIDIGVVKAWYGELKYYDYYSNHCAKQPCGHYTQVAWGKTRLIGCGYNSCKGRYKMTKLYCNYATGGNAPWTGEGPQPYKEGEPCSKCPADYAFCMAGALCASKKACDKSKSSCKCSIKECKNGGTFDAENCKCKCSEGWEGASCDEKCKDVRDVCPQFVKMGYCNYTTYAVLSTLVECRKTCGFCGSTMSKDPDAVNAGELTTNVQKLELDLKPVEQHQRPTLPPRGPCENRLRGNKCDEWARYGNCKTNPLAMKVDCAASCNMCEELKQGACSNKGKDSQCGRWALSGACEKNKIWMHTNCARSCNTC